MTTRYSHPTRRGPLVRARSIPEDVGDNPESKTFDPFFVYDKYRIDDVSIAVGSLVTQ